MTGQILHSRLAWVAASLCAIALNAALVTPDAIRYALRDGGDFPEFYIGAKLVFTGQLYDPARALETQHEFGIEKPGLMPLRPPFYFTLLSPLSRLSYPAAHPIWTAMLIAATVAFLAIYPSSNRSALVIASALSLPLFVSVVYGQDAALMLLILAA